LRIFMEYHVFAVWDFMSLLKSLQRNLTCVEVPWVPTNNAKSRRLINEIVMVEESDVDEKGNNISHYELYLTAMEQCGANTKPIKDFVELIRQGVTVKEALKKLHIPEGIAHFVSQTFAFVDYGNPHQIAGAFTFGREDLIPDMFREVIESLEKSFPNELKTLHYYLDRHVHIDKEIHTPLALQMISELCGKDNQKWRECGQASSKALEVRLEFWDAIFLEIKTKSTLQL
jgi:pyrroloquinoline quinone (PQQ) biosynthesis protein C